MAIAMRADHGFTAWSWGRVGSAQLLMRLRLVGVGTALVLAPTVMAGELEIGVYGGFNESAHSIATLSGAGGTQEDTIGWQGKSFVAPWYYGVRAIYWSERVEDWGVGLDFTHAKAYADIEGSGIGDTYSVLEFTDGLNHLTANVFRKWDFDSGLRVYGGAGLGIGIPHVEVTTLPGSVAGASETFEYQVTGWVAQATAGASYEFTPGVRIFGEYKLAYSINEAQLAGGAGTFSTNLVTHQVLTGVSISFDGPGDF